MAFAADASAETITIRLVNGQTGKPMADKDVAVTFWWNDPSQPAGRQLVKVAMPDGAKETNISLDKDGRARVEIPAQATMVQVERGGQGGRVGDKKIRYSLCARKGDQFVLADRFGVKRLLVPLPELAQHGFVAETLCTPKQAVPAEPGEYVVLAVPDSCFPLCGNAVP
jgi:hypothetical protein